MQTLIIGAGLTNQFLSPDAPYIDNKRNIGKGEIYRLMGWGRAYGQGPLPKFLNRALRAQGERIRLLLLQDIDAIAPEDRGPQEEAGDTQGFSEVLNEIASESTVIKAPESGIPWHAMLKAIKDLTGLNEAAIRSEAPDLRFLVVGCHTEKRILTIATALRNILNCEQVAVSSHLVGSSAREAHLAALRHTLPVNDIEVLLDLDETASYAGMNKAPQKTAGLSACTIEPASARKQLNLESRRIIESLCMHWTRAHLNPLQGGFSGSLLFLADGRKADARTEPLVIKIDNYRQMRREIDGYHQVKDLLGKHIPTFGYPIEMGDTIGVGMELAAMDGSPQTLQDCFEAIESDASLGNFLRCLDKTLDIITERLYRNTLQTAWITPYREFALHTDSELRYLKGNLEFIKAYLEEEKGNSLEIDTDILPKILTLIAKNEDSVEGGICVAHGDLNYQNVIYDQVDNIWFIDWTHCGIHPVELDYGKLENDAKFVLTKQFDVEDLPRLKQFEAYLLSHRLPADSRRLPDELKFAKWDLRYRKILETVIRIRSSCFDLKNDEEWLVYRISLLKYALHTLSFDKRRGRGECDLPQLAYALISAHRLLLDLVSDDFHLKIRSERPPSYPARWRISIDEAPWPVDSPNYSPPYHVDPSVLENDCNKMPQGWADPEDYQSLSPEEQPSGYKYLDDHQRPLHPRGRTGIAGRGLLGRWGPNPAAGAVVLRENAASADIEILLGKKEDAHTWVIPKGFVERNETPAQAAAKTLEIECGWPSPPPSGEAFYIGYTYDARQTDNAWLEISLFMIYCDSSVDIPLFRPGSKFEEVSWQTLSPRIINNIYHGHAQFIRDIVKKLNQEGRIDDERLASILAETG